MQKQIFAFIAVFITVFSTVSIAQNRQALLGSGKVITVQPVVKSFDKVSFKGMNGRVQIEVGKPKCSVSIQVDDNLAALLTTESNGETLTIGLKGNENNRLWIEDSHIVIKIEMPEVSVVQYESNGSLDINGIVGRYFRLENEGNSGVILRGGIDELDIKKAGNGSVDASGLVAKTAKIKSYGNGSVRLNVSGEFSAMGTGNGSVVNVGTGKKSAMSGIVGNGAVMDGSEWQTEQATYANLQRINVILENGGGFKRSYYVSGPNTDGSKFSYGFDIKPAEQLKKTFTVGTKIYSRGKLLRKLTEQDANQVVKL
jgi:Putative auto-transporter adhesin, head GIN domain